MKIQSEIINPTVRKVTPDKKIIILFSFGSAFLLRS